MNIRHEPTLSTAVASPFALAQGDLYQRWRDAKLQDYPDGIDSLVVELTDAGRPTTAEIDEIRRLCTKANMAIYTSDAGATEDKSIARGFGERLGLQHLDPNMLADDDGITSLKVVERKSGACYIPYSNHRLLWHTDGYYNLPARQVRSLILHCVRAAREGGENELLDPELVYIRMRDADPELVSVLMAADAMTIPANVVDGSEIREARTGPVFSIDPVTGNLHMRYTARKRNIVWKPDDATAAAVAMLEQVLAAPEQVFRGLLRPGQGLICNNVLHNRTAFTEDEDVPRLLYRARYYERIENTGWNRIVNGEV